MSRFWDLMGGKKEPTPVPAPAPTPEPVVEEVVESEVDTGGSAESVLENMSKDELEDYGRVLGIELDKRRSKKRLVEEILRAEESGY